MHLHTNPVHVHCSCQTTTRKCTGVSDSTIPVIPTKLPWAPPSFPPGTTSQYYFWGDGSTKRTRSLSLTQALVPRETDLGARTPFTPFESYLDALPGAPLPCLEVSIAVTAWAYRYYATTLLPQHEQINHTTAEADHTLPCRSRDTPHAPHVHNCRCVGTTHCYPAAEAASPKTIRSM